MKKGLIQMDGALPGGDASGEYTSSGPSSCCSRAETSHEWPRESVVCGIKQLQNDVEVTKASTEMMTLSSLQHGKCWNWVWTQERRLKGSRVLYGWRQVPVCKGCLSCTRKWAGGKRLAAECGGANGLGGRPHPGSKYSDQSTRLGSKWHTNSWVCATTGIGCVSSIQKPPPPGNLGVIEAVLPWFLEGPRKEEVAILT